MASALSSSSVAFLLFIGLATLAWGQSVTWYDYYTAGGRQTGLIPANADSFTLNGKPFRVVSGSIHYFRVHPAYWRDRLKKLRAVGANTVETYLPWNLHEPRRAEFDFGEGQNDFSAFLNLTAFVEMAREEDLFVILRPGPFICAEWEFGGLPSWLLRDPDMKVRTTYKGYLDQADDYLGQVFRRISSLQFTKGDGPIIAFQVENEYAAFGSDTAYLIYTRDKMAEFGAVEMFFTSDNGGFDRGRIPGTLTTANFNYGGDGSFNSLRQLQPDFPLMATEYWSGWFDHWGQGYHDTGLSLSDFSNFLDNIFARNGSVNFYMFHGGTTFGFMNGANVQNSFPFYQPTINSYDYAAPLSEAGDYTDKYNAALDIIDRYKWIPNIARPVQPAETLKAAYPTIQATQHLTLDDLLRQVPSTIVIQSPNLLAMEDLPINYNSGQSYGYIHYSKVARLSSGAHRVQTIGRVRDLAVFAVNGQRLSSAWENVNQLGNFGFFGAVNATLDFNVDAAADYTMDFLVENMGRNNYGTSGDFYQKRGLIDGPVLLDQAEVTDWTIYPLEFTSSWIRSLTNWNNGPAPATTIPTLTRAILTITTDPLDTFIVAGDFSAGNRGVVFVNGFNIGRFSVIGPTRTMFVPAPLLKQGDNTIEVFSLFNPVTTISFSDKPDLG